MNKFEIPSSVKAFLVFIIFAGFLTSCIDRPTSGENVEERNVLFFLLVDLDRDSTVFRQTPEGNASGKLNVNNSEISEFLIYFYDENERPFTPAVDKHSLGFEIDGTENISIMQSGNYRFRVTGESLGDASFNLQLLHEDAVEFESLDIPVTISDTD
jgi:hypothetical protein